jgi:hypothetical protein
MHRNRRKCSALGSVAPPFAGFWHDLSKDRIFESPQVV